MNFKFYNIDTKLVFIRKNTLVDKLSVNKKQNCRIFLNYFLRIWKKE